MENKCIKKSTLRQLQALVEYMEEHADFARGCPKFGSSKLSMDEQWVNLSKKLNSMGPPVRSVVEWKKTWADMKSRTKKKIAENKKSINQTGGGLYRMNPLSELELSIDRTLFLSKAAAPSGSVFGCEDEIENCFRELVEPSPPKTNKIVEISSPSKQFETPQKSMEETDASPQQKRQKVYEISDDEPPVCSSSKKKKTVSDEQISLIRRQLRVSEQSAGIAKDQANALKKIADATNGVGGAIERIAKASEIIATAAKNYAETQVKLLTTVEAIHADLKQYLNKK